MRDAWTEFLRWCDPPTQLAMVACPACGGRMAILKGQGPGTCLEPDCGETASLHRLVRVAATALQRQAPGGR